MNDTIHYPLRTRAVATHQPAENNSLIKRLNSLRQLPLKGNEKEWGLLCVEMIGGDLYEHLRTLVEIVHRGDWQSKSNPAAWIRQVLINRCGIRDDYNRMGRRRPGGLRFDHRSCALTHWEARPFAEFEISDGEGGTLLPEEALDGITARAQMQRTDGGCQIALADRESLKRLRRRTLAEANEHDLCKLRLQVLKCNKAAFDRLLLTTIVDMRPLVTHLRIDVDMAEVLAVVALLWSIGPRTYLNYLDQSNHRRLRNAWDRIDRQAKNPKVAEQFRRTLQSFSSNTRRTWEDDEGDYWEDEHSFCYKPVKANRPRNCGCQRCGALDSRLCTCDLGGQRRHTCQQPEMQLRLRAERDQQGGVLLPPIPNIPDRVDLA